MRIFMAIVGLLVATNLALTADLLAADLPVAPAPMAPPARVPASPPVYNWSGFYLGLNGGYGFATASITGTFGGASASASENLSGLVGGGQVGYNYQVGIGVFGIEADLDGSSQNKTTSAGIVSATDKITYIGTVRGRIGAAFDRVLLYATGGGGYGEFTSSVAVAGFGTFSGSKSHAVWTIGAGLEVGITSNISARLEYLHADTGNLNLGTVGGVTVTGRVQDNLVRAGLNFRFPI
jgi:outer membrane immunogenic protein